MDKHIVRQTLDKVAVGAILTLDFIDEYKSLNGTYEVMVSKTGRGRNGSRVIEAKNTETGEMLLGLDVEDRFRLFGSAVSDQILSLAVNGVMVDGSMTQNNEEAVIEPSPSTTLDDGNIVRPYALFGRAGFLNRSGNNETFVSRNLAATIVADAQKRGVAAVPNNSPFRAAKKKAETDAATRAQLAEVLKQTLAEDPRSQLRIKMKESTSNLNGEWRVRAYSTDEDGSVSMELVNLENPETVVGFNTNEFGTEVRAVDVIEYTS